MNHCKLLIVCPPEFASACREYATFKAATGVSCEVQVFDLNSIPLAQPASDWAAIAALYKVDTSSLNEPAARLKAGLLHWYVSRHVRHVLLVGDADRMPVPWFEFEQSGMRYFYPTDLYYADLFKTRSAQPTFEHWDPDHDGIKGEFRSDQIAAIDFAPDLAVGRIPASTLDELRRYFVRLTRQRSQSPRLLFLHGNDASSGDWIASRAHEAAQFIKQRRPWYDVTELSVPSGANLTTANAAVQTLRQKLQQGCDYVFWYGHGGTDRWGSFGPRDLVFAEEIPHVTRAPMVFSVSCEVGAYVKGVGEGPYLSGGVLVPAATATAPVRTPDAVQRLPASDADFAPEAWTVKYTSGASALLAGHSWGSLGTDYLSAPPMHLLEYLAARDLADTAPFVGNAYAYMQRRFVATYRATLATDGPALNHLLRMHLFGDPTAPLAV